MKLLLFFICFLLFFVGFHNIDLAVNVLILDPIRFWSGSDCSLLVCSGYPSIYRMGNFMQFLGFYGLFLLGFYPNGLKNSKNIQANPNDNGVKIIAPNKNIVLSTDIRVKKKPIFDNIQTPVVAALKKIDQTDASGISGGKAGG